MFYDIPHRTFWITSDHGQIFCKLEALKNSHLANVFLVLTKLCTRHQRAVLWSTSRATWVIPGWWTRRRIRVISYGTYRIMYILAWRTVDALTRGLYCCLFPELRSNEENKHKNNTRVSAWTVRHKRTYIILFLRWHNKSINDAKKKDLHSSSPCLTRLLYVLLMTSQSIGDDATMTRQLWRENVTTDI